MHPPADARVLALGVLPDAHDLDVRRPLSTQRALDTGHQANWAQVHVLVEHLADGQQEAPQRYVVAHVRRAHGA
jgi:hypothetical protein